MVILLELTFLSILLILHLFFNVFLTLDKHETWLTLNPWLIFTCAVSAIVFRFPFVSDTDRKPGIGCAMNYIGGKSFFFSETQICAFSVKCRTFWRKSVTKSLRFRYATTTM